MMTAALLAAVAAAFMAVMVRRFTSSGGILEYQRTLKTRMGAGSAADISAVLPVRKQFHLSDVDLFRDLLDRYAIAFKIADILNTLKIKVSVSVFFIGSFLILLTTFVVLARILPPALSMGPAVGVGLAPFFALHYANRKYIRRFTDALPDCLSIISGAIKAGQGLESAIGQVAVSGPYPVNEQFKKVLGEMNLGLSLPEALTNLYRRMQSEELKICVTGISINQELGGNMSEILSNIERTMRDRFALERELKALSAQGVATAWVLGCLPVFVAGTQMMNKNSRQMLIAFSASAPGKMALLVCLFLMTTAIWWILKTIRLKE